jgi:hypothetical protein
MDGLILLIPREMGGVSNKKIEIWTRTIKTSSCRFQNQLGPVLTVVLAKGLQTSVGQFFFCFFANFSQIQSFLSFLFTHDFLVPSLTP